MDAALEEWDESPLEPALAEDKSAQRLATAPTPPASAVIEDRAEDNKSVMPTVRPPEALPELPALDDEDEECTVVGEVPPELLADSVRGLGSASGLGHIFGRGSQPTIPAEDEAEPVRQEVAVDDSAVFTSAPSVGAGPPAEDALKHSNNDVDGEDVEDGDIFDPFADLREEVEDSPKPPAVVLSGAADATPIPSEEVVTSAGLTDTPIPSSSLDEIEAGPKLLEPGERQYSQDDVTAVFTNVEQVSRLVADHAAKASPMETEEQMAVPRSVPPAPPTPAKPQWSDERDAVTHLLERDLRSAWETRAAWFAEEAALREDDAARARIMLTVSELCAMLGDDEKGVAVAQAVRDLDADHPLAHRQARYAMVRERRWFEILGELEAEARTGPTPDAKTHTLLLMSELMERPQRRRRWRCQAG